MSAAATRRTPDSTLGAAVAHPLRSRCLTLLADREASPAEIARELGIEVSKVGYHVSALAKAGLIEKVRERPVRGAVEHFYRATVEPSVADTAYADLGAEARRNFCRTTWSLVTANATTSLESGRMLERDDLHLTRVPIRADEQGWAEIAEAHLELFERVFEIQAASAERLGDHPDDPGISGLSVQAFFETPEAAADTALAETDL
jgi:DNA-binding transcriptional ArsR family regulator